MDQAANTFVDELVKVSDKDFVDDVKVKDKVCRFSFDIMLQSWYCGPADGRDVIGEHR